MTDAHEGGDAQARAHAALAASPDTISDLGNAHGHYSVSCTDCEGRVLWEEEFDNVVPTAGANDVLNKYFAGSAWTAAIKLSIITAGTAVAGSTYAVPTVTEITNTNLAARLPVTFAAAAARSIAANTVAVVISGAGTVNCAGIMMVEGGSAPTTVGDTAGGGVLISAGNFSGGAQPAVSGNTLNVSYTFGI